MNSLERRWALLKKLSALGADAASRRRLAAWALACHAGFAYPVRVRLLFPGGAHEVALRTVSDAWVVKDVLIDREYDSADSAAPRSIVDLGSNIGISALFFALKYPGARVYAVEPNPALAPQLAYNLAGVPNISLHAFALADKDGPVTLHIGRNAAGSSLFPVAGSGGEAQVEGVSARSLLSRLGAETADLIKFDIEGAEQYLFRDFSGLGPVGECVGEMHYDRMPLTRADIRALLPGYLIEERPAGRPDRSLARIRRPPARV